MDDTILVTGGTGTIGARVVPLLVRSHRPVRVLSRHPVDGVAGVRHVGGDTVRDRGLAEAFAGVDTVLHLAGGARGDDVAARHIVAAAREARVSHLVLISVVGAHRMPIGYFRAKAAAEHTVAESGVPWTTIRVAQLHGFLLPVVRTLRRLPLRPAAATLRFEPVDATEVARRLAELTLAPPAGRVADLAGPEVLTATDLTAGYEAAFGLRAHRHLELPIPGAAGRDYRAGENLAVPGSDRGILTWRDYLDAERARSRRR